MFSGHDIIVFTSSDWNATWATPQQIACRLTPENRVLYVDMPRSFMRAFWFSEDQSRGTWEGPPLQEVQPGLHVYHPRDTFFPVGRLPFAISRHTLTWNGRILARKVKQVMAELGMTRPILWNFSPLHGAAAPIIPHDLEVYEICDEWVNYIPDAGGRAVTAWIEGQLTRNADLIFAGTQEAADKRRGLNEAIHVLPQAADVDHFMKATASETSIPDDVAGLPHPIIGSVGVIDPARFDVELIRFLASQRPDWSIVLVGPARRDMNLQPLRGIENVHLLGNRPIAELPAYLKAMDVTIIPYKVNEATRCIYPLKLMEYLAAGNPTVVPAMPSLMRYNDVVEIAENHAGFLERIEWVLEHDNREAFERRQSVTADNSWEKRVVEKMGLIEEALNQKKYQPGGST